MTTEDLLKPRYKVIADYPDNRFKVGEILEDLDKFGFFTKKNLDKYPHLFKRLEWWEEREEEEMPGYIKYKINGKIEKLRRFTINWESHISKFLPATKEEWLQQ